MTQSININQFGQTPIKGSLAKECGSGVLSGIVDAACYVGSPVKISTGAYNKPVPVFTPTSTSEECFGVICFNSRKSTFAANDAVEVAFCSGPVMWMEAAAAVTAGAYIELAVAADVTVQTFSSGKQLGVALDGASAAGQLIRVAIVKPTWRV
jgi:hypothetical protein